MTDRELERVLTATAAATRYPPTPALTDRVLAGIAATPTRPLRSALRLSPLLLTFAVLALLALGAALAIGPSRDAIADFFGIEGSTVERLPTPPAGLTATPFPTPAPIEAVLTPASLTEVAQAVGFDPALPTVDEAPAAAFVRYGKDEAVAVLRYDSFDLWEARLQQDAGFGKELPTDTILEDVQVGAWPAHWISGGPHIVYYSHDYGAPISASLRTVERNTLVWRTDYAFYRVETDLDLDGALAIAKTLP